jgi:glycerophosphoryl diester phosphodiesterase
MVIIAHRGNFDRSSLPENSLAAFRQVWHNGCDGIELDIRLTTDSEIVVIHDAKTGTIANSDLQVSQSTLTQIKSLRNQGRKRNSPSPEVIPTLQEVLNEAPVGKKIYIELKGGDSLVAPLKKIFAKSVCSLRDIFFIGFPDQPMDKVKSAFPENAVYLLFGTGNGGIPPIPEIIKQAHACHVDGVDIESGSMLNAANIARLNRNGLSVHSFLTFKYRTDPVLIRSIADAGVESITTDLPLLAIEALENKNRHPVPNNWQKV